MVGPPSDAAEATMSQHPQQPRPESTPTGCLSALVRLAWMAVGNLALALLAIVVIQAGTFSVADLFFWTVVAALVVIRYIDITRLGGLTASCEPASMRHWYQYTGYLLAASAGLWALAQTVGRLLVR